MSQEQALQFLRTAFAQKEMRQEMLKLIHDLDPQGILDYANGKGYAFDFVELVQAYKELRQHAPKPDPEKLAKFIKEMEQGDVEGLYLKNDYLLPPYLTAPGDDPDYLYSKGGDNPDYLYADSGGISTDYL